jgi:hypothetical protein
MTRNRYDETWHRLRDWTKGQTPSERLAAQVLLRDGYSNLDPSHPLGGPDGGRDAIANRGNERFAMAVYFPRGPQPFNTTKAKFQSDLASASKHEIQGLAFVTNQEITLGQREELRGLSTLLAIDFFHLERITTLLDEPDMAAIRAQFLDIEEDGATISLGGQGGSSPGAGGGGGGAIGSGATGGKGGPGGDWIDLSGNPGTAPGAGGGGVGAIGEGAIAGEGGGGGEHVSVTLGPDDLRNVHHFDIQVGKGGNGPGEDTIVNLVDDAGNVVRQIRAKGGAQGAPAFVPRPSRPPNAADLDSGLEVTSILAAEYIRSRDGLWTIVDGGWEWLQAGTLPFRLPCPLFIEVGTGTIEPRTILELELVVRKPNGFQAFEQRLLVDVQDTTVHRTKLATVVELSGSESGLWRVQITGGAKVLRDFPIEVRLPASPA